jgi:hypothetical protein
MLGNYTDARVGQVGYEGQAERRHDCGVLGAESFGARVVHMRDLEGEESNVLSPLQPWKQWYFGVNSHEPELVNCIH